MRALFLSLLAAITVAAYAQKPSAADVVGQAKTKAAREHKSIFVMFDASW